MNNIKVDIDTNSGFYFGVIYAIDIAEEILAEQDYLYCLGDIVHKDAEVKRFGFFICTQKTRCKKIILQEGIY